MYFLYKAIFDKHIQKSSSFTYENKICGFGKVMAIIAIILAFLRLSYMSSTIYKIIILITYFYNYLFQLS